jgi:rhodanese-related sulfurtransferase
VDDQLSFYESKLAFEIDSFDLNELRLTNAAVVVIDARSAAAYAREHIPGAISLPHREINAETTATFDRSALYVTYCDGIGCNASTKGALALSRLRLRVKELVGGVEWWKRDGFATSGPGIGKEDCGCG